MRKSKPTTLKERLSAVLGWTLIVIGSAIVLQTVAHLDDLFAGHLEAPIPPSAAIAAALAIALLVAGVSHLRPCRQVV
ncbi:hypothetical protein SAMN05444166_7435 [Singulisphaera sp. GP187]|uniref:hypothetical protein n=1 Tax=Singulisphaera sp. GP187 TaxID=1882752 RepID=UPI00092C903C|nr:hypothetical protein [Singulisphaera sp. GP187]SIO64832.1 hypothetical protein SAMN05444166_7435 [Singulisphaera sp. GP187]